MIALLVAVVFLSHALALAAGLWAGYHWPRPRTTRRLRASRRSIANARRGLNKMKREMRQWH